MFVSIDIKRNKRKKIKGIINLSYSILMKNKREKKI